MHIRKGLSTEGNFFLLNFQLHIVLIKMLSALKTYNRTIFFKEYLTKLVFEVNYQINKLTN